MTPRDFVYWLQGYLEISGARVLEEYEVSVIKDHLKLVFQKETPDRSISGPFLGIQKEVFDEKYIKEALGIDVDVEAEKKFVPFESNPAYAQAIVFEAMGKDEINGLKRVPIDYIPYDDKLPDLSHLLQYDGVPISC